MKQDKEPAVFSSRETKGPALSPMGRRLYTLLKHSGKAGLELRKLKIAGARKELKSMVRQGLAVGLDGNMFYARDTYLELIRWILAGLEPGARLDIAEVKARTSLTRKFVIPLLNRMEKDGYLKRVDEFRIVQAGAPEGPF